MKTTILTRGLCLAALTLIVSCKSSTTGPGTSNPTVTKPGVNSTFVFQNTTRDSTGRTVSTRNETHTVFQVNATAAGKTGVMMVQRDNEATGLDTTMMRYETNGDVSVYQGNMWATLPFASQGTTTLQLDSAFEENGIPLQIKGTFTYKGAGTANVTIKGKSYSTQAVHGTGTFGVFLGGQKVADLTPANDYYFSPELGYIVKTDMPPYSNGTSMENGELQLLTDFSVK